MGFNWSVVLAHAFMPPNNETAYEKLLRETPPLNERLQFLRDADALFTISPMPLILLILDDQATITCGWPETLLLDLYRKLRDTMADAGIPIAWRRSSAPTSAAKHEMPFISHIISLDKKEIRCSPDKWAKAAASMQQMRPGTFYGCEQWQTLIGWLKWLAALKCGLLSTFNRIYRTTRGLYMLQKKIYTPEGRRDTYPHT